MKALFVGLLFFASQGALPTTLLAGSTLIDVTPQNIVSQPIEFRVIVEADQHDVVNFDILVSHARDAISKYREGRLEIAREAALQKKPDENLTLQRPMVYCSVREVNENGVLHFQFGVAREFVPKATFQFRNYDPSGMPSMDVYRFVLREFVVKE